MSPPTLQGPPRLRHLKRRDTLNHPLSYFMEARSSSTPTDPAQAPKANGSMPSRVCIIDIGTNSIHSIIVDAYPNGTYTVLDKIKEMVRLGEGGFADQALTEAAIERAVHALQRVRLLADGWNAVEHLAFGTSAIREATNGGVLVRRAKKEADIKIRTIPGALEAKLIYKGVRRAVDLPEPVMLVDIGGGSTEFIISDAREVYFAQSLKAGAARMTEQFVTTDPVNAEEFRAMRSHIREMLQPVFRAARAHDVHELVGSSGTLECIAEAHVRHAGDGSRSIYQQALDGQAIRDVTKRIMLSSRAEREAMPGIDRKRLDQVVAGATLVDVLLKDLGVKRLRLSPNALREGMVDHFIETNYERLEQLAPFAGVRRRGIYALGFRFDWDRPHAEQVARLSLLLFDELAPLHQLGETERELLEYGALLHDIGYHISRRKHHKHSRYLIENADLHGFQPEEIDMMANIARYHRKAVPKRKHTPFMNLSKMHRAVVRRCASLVRLAEALDRSYFQNVDTLTADLTDDVVHLHLYTHADPQLELWAVEQAKGFFEETYDRTLHVTAEPLPDKPEPLALKGAVNGATAA